MKALTWKTQTKLKGDRDIDSTERQKLIKNKKNPGFPGGVSGKELTSQRRHKKKKIKSLEWQKAQQWNKNSEIQKQLLEIKYMITDMKIQQKLRKYSCTPARW